MKTFARELVLLGVAALVSWWVLLRDPVDVDLLAAPPERSARPVSVTPLVEAGEPELASAAEPETSPNPSPHSAAPVPPPEVGDPEGEDEEQEPEASSAPSSSANGADEPAAEERAQDEGPGDSGGPTRTEQLMSSPELVADARRELSGEVRRGFRTDLLSAAEDQIDIARFFGEQLVLVPRQALDPDIESPRWYRLDVDGHPFVEAVSDREPLELYRQYRDLFDYEYARLPAALRELRRSVLARSEIYLFAALIPVPEWAVVVGRRREALAPTGRDLTEVSRFVLRYERRADDGFDLRVQEIVFSDGTRHNPNQATNGG